MPKKAKSVSSRKPKKGKSVSSMNRKLSDKRFVFHSSEEKPFVFHCSDLVVNNVDIRCCYESELMATMYSMGLVHFSLRMNSHILSLVNDFCIRRVQIFQDCAHDDHLFSEELRQYEGVFLARHPHHVHRDLMSAAHDLKIASLFYMICNQPSNETPMLERESVLTVGLKVLMENMCPPDVVDAHLSNCASLKYDCLDDKIVNVDPRCCFESEHVYHTLSETENDEKDTVYRKAVVGDIGRRPSKVPIPSNILSMVNYFCMSRFFLMESYGYDDNLYSDMLEFFDCCFVQSQPLSLLVQLMHAAYEMRVQSLLDLTRNAIVPKLDRKSADEILKIFNLPDFDHKVWEESWLLEALPVKKMMIF